jgi:hypothetical protein
MNAAATPVEGEVLDSMPAAQPAPAASTALAPATNPFQHMAMMAMEKGAMDQLERLLELQLKWDAEQQRKAFVAAMVGFKAEAGSITIAKSKHVSFRNKAGNLTEYDHAELHDITRALVPMMARHGLSHRWVPVQAGNGITITCVMSHRDGHSESVSLSAQPDDSGGKNSIQAVASTNTYLERYTLLAATGMATGGEFDDDGRSHGQTIDNTIVCITEEQAKILSDLIAAYTVNKEGFMDWVRGATKDREIKVVADIQAKHYDLVHDQLGRLREQKLAKTKADHG